jgi:high-affinity nickel-transport protein
MELMQAAQAGGLTLLGTALGLGMRHGIDWDHIAAISDITSTTTNVETGDVEVGPDGAAALRRAGFGAVEMRAFWLASLYALGHALVVALLGLAALYFDALLPDWIDPVMERLVGVTLLALGVWVFYSLFVYWRGEGDFRLQSRWMLVFAMVRRGWHQLQHRFGSTHHHHHSDLRVDQYGARTAFSVGLLHGVGAETGSQVLIIAAVGGAASQGFGTAMMFAFIVGLLISNSAVALLTSTGFISSTRAKSLYVLVGCFAGLFSLLVGAYFTLGAGDQLPDLQHVLDLIFGEAAA